LDGTPLPDYRLQAIEPADFTHSYAEGYNQLLRVFADKDHPEIVETKENPQAFTPDPQVVKNVCEEICPIL